MHGIFQQTTLGVWTMNQLSPQTSPRNLHEKSHNLPTVSNIWTPWGQEPWVSKTFFQLNTYVLMLVKFSNHIWTSNCSTQTVSFMAHSNPMFKVKGDITIRRKNILRKPWQKKVCEFTTFREKIQVNNQHYTWDDARYRRYAYLIQPPKVRCRTT